MKSGNFVLRNHGWLPLDRLCHTHVTISLSQKLMTGSSFSSGASVRGFVAFK